jgi:crotonobetainyl-CoA:carnitine CoA-transferase CaiB-like acyl-CoA transferase
MRWWGRLVEMMNMPELHHDARFNTEEARLNPAHRAPFLALFESWLLRYTRQEIIRKAQAARLPGTAVLTPGEVLRDPHFTARGAFVPVTHPVAGTWLMPGAPFRPNVTPWQVRQPAPTLGQHTATVLQELLHLTPGELAELHHLGVTG